MDVSRKTDYALRMLAALVRSPGVVSVSSVARQNDVPYSFARSIQHELVKAGIICSTRGTHGGMSLAVDPHDITMLEIVEAVQGPIRVAECDVDAGGAKCPRSEDCPFNGIWCCARSLLTQYFSSITLADAVEGKVVASWRAVPVLHGGQAGGEGDAAGSAAALPEAPADEAPADEAGKLA